jgi:excinuclease ABC subunit A
MENIEVFGARIHNLKNIDVKIPKGKIVAITGVSGSGKSSLAFDLLFEEGRTRYLQAIGLPPRLEREKEFDSILGLAPTIAVEQRTVRHRNPRSTVGTKTGIYNYLRMLFAAEGQRFCPMCKEKVKDDMSCDLCGFVVDRLEIKHFSFNEPSGMCPKCKGRGYIQEFRPEKVLINPNFTIWEICASPDATGSFADLKNWTPGLAEHYNFDLDTPYKDLSKKIQQMFLYGSNGEEIHFHYESKRFNGTIAREYEGVIPHLHRAMVKSSSDYRRRIIEKNFMDKVLCPECNGFQINENARETLVGDKHIGELAQFTINDLIQYLKGLPKSTFKTDHGEAMVKKVLRDLEKFLLVGLSYLHLNRTIRSLSGGEIQRLSLMTQMNLGLNGVILILDEPTMGMHEKEKKYLGEILINLRDAGNTVIIVEHDERLMKIADQIIDLGPGPGVKGGNIVYQGLLDGIKKNKNSYTGRYLSQVLKYPKKSEKDRLIPEKNHVLQLQNFTTNNLKDIYVDIPLGLMVGIAGVSGSGKSSLITDTLVPLILKQLKNTKKKKKSTKKSSKTSKSSKKSPKKKKIMSDETEIDEDEQDPFENVGGTIEGSDQIDDCIVVDQSPIGKNRNSIPATYIGVWDQIRKLFANQPAAKKKKFKDGHFSFNSDKGRCPACKGEGKIGLSISFLDELSLTCEECDGQRYIPTVLSIKYNGKNIREMLDVSVEESLKIFKDEPRIYKYMKILDDIGMGYMTLGQPATTLSGGEAQRVKLAKALGNQRRTNTLFVLDEPSTGLHFHDEVKLIKLLNRLVEQGNSVFLIEHNVKILSYCDWILELGPEGGPKGGYIIAKGSPEEIKNNKKSLIAEFLDI